jgi:uncharacterized protein
MNIPLDLILGFAIGLSLGLLGGGGSILTVPALVYLVGQSPQAAVTTSLAIVGANSLLGAWFHKGQGKLNGHVALVFGGAGMLAAYLSSGLSGFFSPQALMIAFAVLMLVVGALMLRRPYEAKGPRRSQPNLGIILISGVGVGLLTGALGVGGGFLIVPALVMLVGLPIYEAIGTSLVVIAANSLAGFLGHINSGMCDIPLVLVFVAAGLAGTYFGARLAGRLPANRLRQAFGFFVICLAIALLVDNLGAFL